jgi:peptide/nickel transport system ATP-binding protein
LLTALERPDRGVVRFDGHAISAMSESDVRPLRRRFQPVFQDPLASLDPRMRVERSVAEPLAAMGVGSDDRRQRVSELLRQVGLSSDLGRRLPAALSGGERQRAAIARALAPVPELLVLDEPVTSLDATAALELIELLRELQRRLELTLLLVTHDMDVVREFCDRVVVMERGRVVEEGETNRIFAEPRHDSTCALIRAVPRLDI